MDILNTILDIVFGNGSVFQNIIILLIGIGLLLLFMRIWRNAKGVAPVIQKTSRVIFIGSLVLNVVLIGFINFARQNIEEIQGQSLFVCAFIGTDSDACKGVREEENKVLTRKVKKNEALEEHEAKLDEINRLALRRQGKTAEQLRKLWNKKNIQEVKDLLDKEVEAEYAEYGISTASNTTDGEWPASPVPQQ